MKKKESYIYIYILLSKEIEKKSEALESFKSRLSDSFTRDVIQDYTKEIQVLESIKSKIEKA